MQIGRPTILRRLFLLFNAVFLVLLAVVTLYPFLYVLAASFSKPIFIMQGKVSIIPMGFSWTAYERVVSYNYIWSSYRNTLVYVALGTAINLLFTVFAAYPLSRTYFMGRRFFTFFIAFTMWFSAGMIPTFLVVKGVGLYNNIGAMVIPTAISTFNMFIMRTFFQGIPTELEDAALIDGCNDMQALFQIILPLSVSSLVTIGMFYAVGHWNGFMQALIYLRDKDLYPIQMILREIVLQNDAANEMMGRYYEETEVVVESVKYATIIFASLPILCVYPFIQKYFVKGVMVGSIKG